MIAVTLIEKVKFEAECRGHKITLDQPVEDGGSDAGMTPVELFIASLGSCIGYFAAVFCQRHKIATNGLRVNLDWLWAEDPHRIGAITAEIICPTELSEKEMAGLLRMVKGCTVHNTLTNIPNITILIK